MLSFNYHLIDMSKNGVTKVVNDSDKLRIITCNILAIIKDFKSSKHRELNLIFQKNCFTSFIDFIMLSDHNKKLCQL